MTVTSGLHIQKDKERQKRMESDIRWGLKDPESGEEEFSQRLKHLGGMMMMFITITARD